MSAPLLGRIGLLLALVLPFVSPLKAQTLPRATTAYDERDCRQWTRPKANSNAPDAEPEKKWKDRMDSGMRCMAARLDVLKSQVEEQSLSQAKDHTVANVVDALSDVRKELTAINKWLQETKLEVKVAEYRGAIIDPKLRELLEEQVLTSRAILEAIEAATHGSEPGSSFNASWLVVQAAAAGAGAGGASAKPETPGTQVNPAVDLPSLFPNAARIEVAIATVADPRVPRHRRFYDNQITAISQGMLVNGFVLDRYQFPWQEALKPNGSGFSALIDVSDDKRFGLMIYRRDNWRYKDGSANRDVRAIYVVPEAATYGVQSGSFEMALQRIDDQVLPNTAARICSDSEYSSSEECDRWRGTRESGGDQKSPEARKLYEDRMNAAAVVIRCHGELPIIRVFGPSFSGSYDSIGRVAARRRPRSDRNLALHLRVESASATARSNSMADSLLPSPHSLDHLPRTDTQKLEELAHALATLRVKVGPSTAKDEVSILYESSVFGFDACQNTGGGKLEICAAQRQIAFPANIADIRFGLTKRDAQREQAKTVIEIPRFGLPHLALAEGAENGSEFPESIQSPLTAVANQLDLDVAISKLKHSPPRVAVIIATDVRDRIFLFEQLRSQLKNTLLVDLETDRLLAHPDIINATRGAITLASSDINAQSGAWSTDHQALLAAQICHWSTSTDSRYRPEHGCERMGPWLDGGDDRVHVHTVARDGLLAASDVWEAGNANEQELRPSMKLLWMPALILFLYLLLCGALLYRARHADRNAPERCLDSRMALLLTLLPVLVYVQTSAKVWVAIVIVIAVGTFSSLRKMFVDIVASMRDTNPVDLNKTSELAWLALPAIAAFQLLLVFALEVCNLLMGIPSSALAAPHSIEAQLLLLQLGLTANAGSGLAYGLTVCAIGGSLLFAFSASVAYSAVIRRNDYVHPVDGKKYPETVAGQDGNSSKESKGVGKVTGYLVRKGRRALAYRAEECRWIIAALGGLVALWIIVGRVLEGQLRLTVFGNVGSVTVYFGLLAVTISGTLMFAAAPWIAARLTTLCGDLEVPYRRHRSDPKAAAFTWDLATGDAPRFATTPMLATHAGVSDKIEDFLAKPNDWRGELGRLFDSDSGSNECWLAAYALLASYMTAYRWAVIGVLVSTLSAACIVYLFPVSDSDGLLLFNLCLLLAIGMHSAWSTVRFETDPILSRVLCNREQKATLSTSLFGFIAFPFAALAVAVAIAQIPGVLNWGDSIFEPLMKFVTPGAFK